MPLSVWSHGLPLPSCSGLNRAAPSAIAHANYIVSHRSRSVSIKADLSCRSLHHASKNCEQGAVSPRIPTPVTSLPPLPSLEKPNIRDRLRKWHEEQTASKEDGFLPLHRQYASLNHAADDYMNPSLQQKDDQVFDDDADSEDFTKDFDRMSGEYEGTDPGQANFRKGDILEVSTGAAGRPRLCVFLKNAQNYALVLNESGRIGCQLMGTAHFACPGQFTEEELAPVMEYLPENPFLDILTTIQQYSESMPRNVSSHVIRKLRDFAMAVDEAFRTHSKALHNIHNVVAHPTQAKNMTLPEIAAKLIGTPTSESHDLPDSLLLAVSFACIHTAFGFKVASRSYLDTRTLFVESQYSVAAVKRVIGWVRAYQEEATSQIRKLKPSATTKQMAQPIHLFAQKAQRLVAASREIRLYAANDAIIGTKPEYLEHPEKARPLINTTFTEQDRDIIHFLSLYLSGRVFFYHPRIVGISAIIVRAAKGNDASEISDAAIDPDAAHTFLVEIGVMQPFNDAEAFDRELWVQDATLQKELDDQQAEIDAGRPVNESAQLQDSMASIRHDWGDLPVYCIDSSATVEIDDGISVEEIAGSPGHVWVHAHVAHVSSHTSPDHVVGRSAENHFQTTYSPEAKFSMLPKYVHEKFSIQPHAPVITTSMHFNEEGKLVEHKMSAGIVRNVVKVSTDKIDAFFGATRAATRPIVMTVGESAKPPEPMIASESVSVDSSIIPLEHHASIRRLHDVASRISADRPRSNVRSYGDRTMINVFNRPRDPTIPDHHANPAAFSMYPTPTVPSYGLRFPAQRMAINPSYDTELLRSDNTHLPSTSLVSHIMTLANAVSAKFAAERDVPMVYYATQPAAAHIQEQLPLMRERLKRMANGDEPVERGFLSYTRNAFGIRHLTSAPQRNTLMALEAYTKTTSPLRRYYDLVSLWQIDATLRYEHDAGRSLKTRSMRLDWYENPLSPSSDLNHEALSESQSEASGVENGVIRPTSPATVAQKAPVPFKSPYSHAAMRALIERTATLYTGQMRFGYTHEKHFIVQTFARALYFSPENIRPYYGDPDLMTSDGHGASTGARPRPGPDVLNPAEGKFAVIVGKAGSRRRQLRFEGLEVICDTEDQAGLEDKQAPAEGQRWAARVERIRHGTKRIEVRLLRRLED